ncbi:ATP-binding protein [Pseudolactococcus reticulitermitis]|uniref:ATP-binding protein n=1 Tax=Pseudolactococcus reticulitermitis TaxID=2025039 RepID=A0A224X1C7_9LACT|nr:ATP-binding protein [Lactococcus reticulitermitis]GAX46706.1 hypothetical protein RsY01_285 [Lactococcus reticulitermitis]
MENKTIILVPDASNLIESQRSIGYTFETAVADIIDNSISANAKYIDVLFENENRYVAIIDNGYGMSEEELISAMKYGSKSILEERHKNDLGRFGLGLKMASFSQCRKLTVVSCEENGEMSGAVWDLDIISKTNDWTLKILSREDISNILIEKSVSNFESGTVVIWEKFDKISDKRQFDELLSKTDLHVSLVFHRYLEKNLAIKFNGRQLLPVDPYFTKNKATQPLEEESIRFSDRRITVKPYIIPYQNRLSQEEKRFLEKYYEFNINQGLYIYRNRRLITWGKWFNVARSNELSNLAKIRIDLPNSMDDSWEIDVKKSTLNIPVGIKTQLKEIITRTIGKSERVYKHRGNKRNNDGLIHIFDRFEKDKKVSYEINQNNPILRQLFENISDQDSRLLMIFIKQVSNNIPFDSIRYDMASKDREVEKVSSSTDDEVYEEIMTLMSFQSDIFSKQKLLQNLKNTEVYQNKKTILEKIEGELND